jgi:hypothetical protein
VAGESGRSERLIHTAVIEADRAWNMGSSILSIQLTTSHLRVFISIVFLISSFAILLPAIRARSNDSQGLLRFICRVSHHLMSWVVQTSTLLRMRRFHVIRAETFGNHTVQASNNRAVRRRRSINCIAGARIDPLHVRRVIGDHADTIKRANY